MLNLNRRLRKSRAALRDAVALPEDAEIAGQERPRCAAHIDFRFEAEG